MTQQMVAEFIKVTGYKVPYIPEYQYYFNLISQVDPSFEEKLDLFKKSWSLYLESGKNSYKSYKLDLVNDLIEQFKPKLDILNSIALPEHGYSELDGKLTEGYYFSIDLVQANHQVFQSVGIEQKQEFIRFEDNEEVRKALNYDEFLINQKTLRQVIYGNLNPKRQIVLQKQIMQKLFLTLKEKLVGVEDKFPFCKKNSDELVIKVINTKESGVMDAYLKLFLIKVKEQFNIEAKITKFKITTITDNIHPTIKIKEDLTTGRKTFYEMDGSEYFKNLKYILPTHQFDARDNYFTHNGRLATWLDLTTPNSELITK